MVYKLYKTCLKAQESHQESADSQQDQPLTRRTARALLSMIQNPAVQLTAPRSNLLTSVRFLIAMIHRLII